MAPVHGKRFLQIVESVRSKVTECTIDDVVVRQQSGDTFILIDVREESEHASGRIPGAVHLGKGVIERDIESRFPDAATPLVLYCGGGYRSALAAWNLQLMGYCNVVSMDGGMRAWKDAGLTIEQP